jgi:hypothetical protein
MKLLIYNLLYFLAASSPMSPLTSYNDVEINDGLRSSRFSSNSINTVILNPGAASNQPQTPSELAELEPLTSTTTVEAEICVISAASS